MKKKRRYKVKPRIKFLERAEIEQIVAHARSSRDKALMCALFSTGLRIAEAVAIKRSDFDAGAVAWGDTKELSIVGKGGWQRVVFFSPDALAAIKSYLAERTDTDQRLFPMTTRTAERIIKEAAQDAGLVATPHTFRHSLATHLLKKGVNIRVVQEMLGHRALSSTMVYTGVTNKDLLEVHKQLI